MAAAAERTDPALWEKVKRRVTAGDKGGEPGQWSARKAQLAVQEYKKAGGGYRGAKSADNHLRQWTGEEWGTRSGAGSKDTGERYLPKRARAQLSEGEYARTTAKKRADKAAGKQHSAQPKDVARKTAASRRTTEPAPERDGKTARASATRRTAASNSAERPAAAKRKAPAKRVASKATPPQPKRAAAARKTAPTKRGPRR